MTTDHAGTGPVSSPALSTYRYLRLAIVVVVLALFMSVGFERANATCWNDSVSAYYYTPVHSIFVGALVVIGVSLFAIRGGTVVEEILLNMAGFLAPVVAFVPTEWASNDCPSNLSGATKTALNSYLANHRFFAKFSTNNLLVIIVAGVVAVLLAAGVALLRRKRAADEARPRARVNAGKELGVPALGSVLVVVVGYIWHAEWPAAFNAHAHGYSAVTMFLFVFGVMISTSAREDTPYRLMYALCAGAMALGALAVFIAGKLATKTWNHQILVLEAIEASAFGAFWFLQTLQLWDEESKQPVDTKPVARLLRRSARGGGARVLPAGPPGGPSTDR